MSGEKIDFVPFAASNDDHIFQYVLACYDITLLHPQGEIQHPA